MQLGPSRRPALAAATTDEDAGVSASHMLSILARPQRRPCRQFLHNPKAYRRGVFQELKDIGFNGSWLEWFLKETETFHGA